MILPLFGVVMDFQESLFFYSIPPLLFLNSQFEFQKSRTHISPLTYFFQGTLILLFILSTILSLNPGSSYYYLWTFLTIILITNLASIYIVEPKQLYSVTLIISVIYSLALITSKLGLLQLSAKELGDNFILQVWGHSYLGNFLLIPLAICFHRLDKKNIYYYSLLIIFFSTALLLSQSRSGVIGAVITLLLIPAISPVQRISKKILFGIFILILGGLLLFSSLKIATYKSTDGSRPIFWRQALSGIQKSPLFGNGPATFAIINRQFKQPHEEITNTTHNSVLEFLTNNGIFFTTIFLFYIFWGLKKQRLENPLLFAIGLGLFISSLFDSFLAFPGFLVILLITATYHHPDYYYRLAVRSKSTTFILGVVSFLIFSFSLLKTGSDIAYWRQQYALSLKLDPFNLNSLLQLHDKPTVQRMAFTYPHEEVALISAINQTRLPDSIPFYHRLFETNPQTNPDYYYQLGQYYSDVHKYPELEELLKKFDYQFYDKKDGRSQLQMAKLFYYLSIFKWQESKPSEAINLAQKAIHYSNGWSHFHIELANMYWHSLQKELAVTQLSVKCHLYLPSIPACDNYLTENKTNFLLPGTSDFFRSIEQLEN